MTWLRPILLLAGAIFIGLLVWWESRRPRQAQGGDVAPAARTEPAFGADVDAVAERGASDRELRRSPPLSSWSDEISPALHAGGAAPLAAAEAQPAILGPALIVDWPEESVRRIVTLRIVPARHDRLAGRALRQGLTGCGFRHGQFGIFHLPGEDGRVVISAASLVRPGMLDPATMDFQRFSGINLFAVLPGPLSHELALHLLGQVAVELATRVDGLVQDDSGAPFDVRKTLAWRERCLAAIEGPGASAGPAG